MSLFRRALASNIGQLIIEVIAIAIPLVLVTSLLGLLPASLQQSAFGDFLLNVVAAIVIVVLFRLVLHRVEHITLSEAGWPRHEWLRPFLLSFFCGGALMTVVILALAITGSYHITGINPLAAVQFGFFIASLCLLALLFTKKRKIGFLHYVLFVCLFFGLFGTIVSLLIFIAGAIQEELIFRGLIFRKLEQSFGSWIALAISAVLFGLIHLATPHATLVSLIALMVTAGVLIASVYILTRSLWWAIGLHLGWNFFEGPVFGTQVSGHVLPGFFSATLTGPDAWTGGSFGPEAGLACILLVGSFGFFLYFRAVRSHRVLARSRQQSVSHDTAPGGTDVPVNS